MSQVQPAPGARPTDTEITSNSVLGATDPTVPVLDPLMLQNPQSPNNPVTRQLATILGLIGGDSYTKGPGQGYGSDQLGQELSANQQAPPAPPATVVAQGTPTFPVGATLGTADAHSGNWGFDLLTHMGLPVTFANLKALAAWHQAEGGSAAYNWMNTTQSAPGASNYNSVGVKNYSSYAQGIDATAQTLANGHYGAILAALRAGNDAHAVASAVGSSPWGTSGSLMNQILGG